MSKHRTTFGQWLSNAFGSSHKPISEKLTAEEYSQFTAEAQALAPQDTDETEEEEEEEQTTQQANLSIEQRLSAMEDKLKKEQSANAKLKADLSQAQNALQKSETQKSKLRQAVNPLGESDPADQKQVDEKFITEADQEARKAWKENQV